MEQLPKVPKHLWTLGAGYDLFGEYALGGSTKLSIFDWNKSSFVSKENLSIPNIVTYEGMNITKSKVFHGESAKKIQNEFSVSVNGGGSYLNLFSGSVNSSFSLKSLELTRNYFTIIFLILNQFKLSFDPLSVNAKELLTDEFKYALDNYDPIILFDIYGTHFLKEIILGGRLEYSCETDISKYQSSYDISVAAEAKLNFIIGSAAGGTSSTYSNTKDTFNKSTAEKLSCRGGDISHAAMLGNEEISVNKTNYQKWLNSVKTDPVFTDFGSDSALMGIWNLLPAGSSTRRLELENAANQYILHKGKTFGISNSKIIEVEVLASAKSGANINGYERFNYDLNKGTGGDYIYIYYRRKTQENMEQEQFLPITDIKIISDKDSIPTGYKKIPVNLNQGVKSIGNFVKPMKLYLCKKYGIPNDPNAITDIIVVGSDNAYAIAPMGYTLINKNLNATKIPHGITMGKKYIYLCYKK